jgi:hypothetical protein
MTVRYAVLLKVHYWDDFTERRLRHLLSKVGTGDVYVFVDETHGAVGQIPHDRVIRATERDMEQLEIELYPLGQVFWYGVDYPLYYFYLQNRSYDYYLMCEHDAVFNVDIDEFVRAADKDRIDYVGFPLAQTAWPLHTCEGVYPKSFKLHQWLSCLSLHSKRSVEFLLERRQVLTRRYKAGEIANWPMNEAFIPTEMLNNGFVVRELGDFGKVDKYDWWPASHEDDLPLLQDRAFLHPVLAGRRYVVSCLRYSNLLNYRSYLRNSQLRQLLSRRLPLSRMPLFLKEFMRQAVRRITPAFLLGLMPQTRNAGNFRRLLRRLQYPN